MEQNGEWIKSILFEDEDEKNADFNWDADIRDEPVRPAVVNRFREINFNQESVIKIVLDITDGKIRVIILDNDKYRKYLMDINNP